MHIWRRSRQVGTVMSNRLVGTLNENISLYSIFLVLTRTAFLSCPDSEFLINSVKRVQILSAGVSSLSPQSQIISRMYHRAFMLESEKSLAKKKRNGTLKVSN